MRKIMLCLFSTILFLADIQAQSQEPSFKGGKKALEKYLRKNIQLPEKIAKSQISETVFVNFIVTKEGKITNVKILERATQCTECDTEASRLVSQMPDWEAGKDETGKPFTFGATQQIAIEFSANAKKILSDQKYVAHERNSPPILLPPPTVDDVQKGRYTPPPSPVEVNGKDVATPTFEGEPLYSMTQEMPQFKGGVEAFEQYIQKNIQYPPQAKKDKIEGKVYVRFIVTKTGKITQVEVIRHMQNCPECVAEAIRVIKAMPDWIPARQQGQPVHVHYSYPVKFKLGE